MRHAHQQRGRADRPRREPDRPLAHEGIGDAVRAAGGDQDPAEHGAQAHHGAGARQRAAEARRETLDLRLDPLALAGEPVVEQALAFVERHAGDTVLLHATAAPDALAHVQATLGVERAGTLVEGALAAIARAPAEHGSTTAGRSRRTT